jgi:DNA-binding CsgD family transcriptional regulator
MPQTHMQRTGNASRETGIEPFAAESMKFITQMSSVDFVTMHVFDESGQRVWLGSRGAPSAFRTTYYSEQMWRIDPLGPIRAGGGERAVTDLQTAEGPFRGTDPARYRAFLSSFGIIDAAEMVFRDGNELIGGMSLLRTGTSPGTLRGELQVLNNLHRYIQLSFQAALRGTLIGWRKSLVREFSLTPRELEVVELVCAGQTNCELGRLLRISLPTVKSHLSNIFQKLGVRNRAALVQRTLGSVCH